MSRLSLAASRRVVQADPLNAETPLDALAEPLTPPGLFFVRTNFGVPRIDPDRWRLRIGGLVEHELELDLRELEAMPNTELVAVLECAGNGRTLMTPVPDGTPWELGAVSSARFEGVPLAHVLALSGVRRDAVEVVFRGADSGRIAGDRVVHFERSLPIARALDPAVLLVTRMNGAALPAEHGFPLRLLVPGCYGVASVKWLEAITVTDTAFAGHFQKERYVYLGHPLHAQDTPVTRMHVRSLIASPAHGAVLQGRVTIRGTAWSGYGAILGVHVSTDGGATWQDAHVEAPLSEHAAVAWQLDWHPAPGDHEIIACARDASGEEQPLAPVPNELGYANNVVHRVRIRATG